MSGYRTIAACAALLLIGAASSGSSLAADTAEISSMPASQTYDPAPQPPSYGARTPIYGTRAPANQAAASGVREYMDAAEEISLFGARLRIDQRNAEQTVQGLLVVQVAARGPAAEAGLRPYRQPVRDALSGASVLAAMAFPPAALALPLVESVPLGESYDLIIGVDGCRVANFIDLYAALRDFRPGEIVYLSILRNGRRIQVPLRVAAALPPPEAWVR